MRGNSPKRGEIYWVNLCPAVGMETKKRRPALIVSNDIGNEVSGIVQIAPITSNTTKVLPFEVGVDINGRAGKVMLNQSRAVDKSRLMGKLGLLEPKSMLAINEAIKIVFGI